MNAHKIQIAQVSVHIVFPRYLSNEYVINYERLYFICLCNSNRNEFVVNVECDDFQH